MKIPFDEYCIELSQHLGKAIQTYIKLFEVITNLVWISKSPPLAIQSRETQRISWLSAIIERDLMTHIISRLGDIQYSPCKGRIYEKTTFDKNRIARAYN